MCLRVDLIISILIFISLCCVSLSARYKKSYPKPKVKQGPSGFSFNDSTTCVEFAKYARFNPYSVLYEKWVVFYYWAPPMPLETYIFTFPTANHTKHLHKLLDGNTLLPVDWSARQILMEDHMNETSLLVERSDRGEYWLYLLYRVNKGAKIKPRDIRLKQTADNRILGIMDCQRETLLVMSRINDVPPKKHLQEEAARLGYRGRGGKSYLYQGHEWMPIPEDNEENYWAPPKTSKDPEKSSGEEVDSPPTNVLEESNAEKTNQYEAELHMDEKEKELKERCIEIKPVYYYYPNNPDPTVDSQYIGLTKDQLSNVETNEEKTSESIIAPDSSLANNEPDNNLIKESESHINNKQDNLQDTNDSEKEQTERKSKYFETLTNKEAQLTEESDKHITLNSGSSVGCKDCYTSGYLKSKSTNTLYMSENAVLRENPGKAPMTRDPMSLVVSSEPVLQTPDEPMSPNGSAGRNPQRSDKSVDRQVSTDQSLQTFDELVSLKVPIERTLQTFDESVSPHTSTERTQQTSSESVSPHASLEQNPQTSDQSVNLQVSTERALQTSDESVSPHSSTGRNHQTSHESFSPQVSSESVSPQTVKNPVSPEPHSAPIHM